MQGRLLYAHKQSQSPAAEEEEIAYVICTFTYCLTVGTRTGAKTLWIRKEPCWEGRVCGSRNGLKS